MGALVAFAVVRAGQQPVVAGDDASSATLIEIDSLRSQLRAAEARLAAVEGRPDPAVAVETLAGDVVSLRDDVRAELELVDGSLRILSERIDRLRVSELARGAAAAAARERELTEEELADWVKMARTEGDPGARFSALEMLGHRRSDRASRRRSRGSRTRVRSTSSCGRRSAIWGHSGNARQRSWWREC